MLSFEEKIMVLALIRSLNLSRAVAIVAKMKRLPSPTVREELDKLDSTHYLLDDGFVEKSHTGIVQYVEFYCPQQPNAVTKEFFDSCDKKKQEALLEALSAMRCRHLIDRSFRPAPITKKVKHAKVEEVQQAS